MPRATYNHPLFGAVEFETKQPIWVRGDQISFISGFDTSEIKDVIIPQLKKVHGSNNGKLKFHERAHNQLLMVFEDIEKLGLMKFINSCAGSLNFRLRKPVHGALSKLPSNHAVGIAIDLNADDKALGASVAPVAPVFQALGFKWGIEFDDPMHFEVEEFIPNPISVAKHLK